MTAEIGLFLGFASMFYGRLFFIGCTRVCLAVYGIVHLVIVFDICACVCVVGISMMEGMGLGPKKWVCVVLKFLRVGWNGGFIGFASGFILVVKMDCVIPHMVDEMCSRA